LTNQQFDEYEEFIDVTTDFVSLLWSLRVDINGSVGDASTEMF